MPSLIPPPTIPRLFYRYNIPDVPRAGNIDVLGQAFHATSSGPPLIQGVLDAQCVLSLLLYDIMAYNVSEGIERASKEDSLRRYEFYQRLRTWSDNLPATLNSDVNFVPQTFLLR
jgi:hypothetical protein